MGFLNEIMVFNTLADHFINIHFQVFFSIPGVLFDARWKIIKLYQIQRLKKAVLYSQITSIGSVMMYMSMPL